jgi:hypothetical protein
MALVRARHMKSLVRAVDLLEPELALQVRDCFGVESLRAVRDATPLAWLPLSMNVELTEAVTLIIGAERAAPFFRGMVLREYKTSLFKTFIDGVTRAMRVTPAVFVKLAPRGWDLVYQDCGVLKPLELGASRARLSIGELPALCTRDAVWLESVKNSFYTAFDLSHVEGDVVFEEMNLERRRAVFEFRWQPRG